METVHLSLRAALAEDRLEDFVRQAMTRGLEFTRGSEFERGLALLLVQRERANRRAARTAPRSRRRVSAMGVGPAG